LGYDHISVRGRGLPAPGQLPLAWWGTIMGSAHIFTHHTDILLNVQMFYSSYKYSYP
jgi:hypothetical protein